jgi:hypothetical protein
MARRSDGPADGSEAVAIAAAVDASACGPARLRAAAAALAGRPVAVVGTLPDAERASACGLRVAACCAPPLGSVRLGRRAFLRAVGGPRPYGTLFAVGGRAEEAVRLAGIRAAELALALPDPLRPLDRRSVRADWGVSEGDVVCLALGAPPSAVDARKVLDIAGRAAYLGGPVVVVAHPDSAGIGHAMRFANAAGDAWRLVVDDRADEPELLARAVDVAVAVQSGRGPDGDPMVLQAALRAGVPVVAAEDVPGAGDLHPGRRFDPRRPNVAARQLRDAASGACADTSLADAAP